MTDQPLPYQVRDGEGTVWTRIGGGPSYSCEHSTIRNLTALDDGYTPVEPTDRARAFLAEVVRIARAYGVILDHEDTHGAFIVRPRGEWQQGPEEADERLLAADVQN